ncbi:MAG: Fur family transcriptional regulator [Candidatus Cryptobacteroides sp.]
MFPDSVMTEESFRKILKKHSLKATPQRLAVFRAMCGMGHASADQVSEYIQKEGEVKITVASVYNILTEFTELGVFKHRLSADSKMFFDITTEEHAHFYDIDNSCFRDLAIDKTIEELTAKLMKRKFKGYKVDYVDIQIVGHPTKRKRSNS